MIQMGKSMPCLYEQMAAVPAMASAQQSGEGHVSQSYEQMLGGSAGAGSVTLVPQNHAEGQFQPTPDEIDESRTAVTMGSTSR